MPRRRVAVAALAPDAVAADRIDVLRRALGAEPPFHVAPHVTLVPPVNVREEDLAEVSATLRSAASAARPFEAHVGPATTFAPVTPTLHLDVDAAATAHLGALRTALRTGVLERPEQWPEYRPHVTLREEVAVDAIDGAVRALAGFRTTWRVDRLHLLEQRRRDDGTPHWVPVREEPFGGPDVVGRGGVELVLRTVAMVEDPVAERCGVDPVGPLGPPGRPAPLVVVAEAPGAPTSVLGAAVGSLGVGEAAALRAVVVDEVERGTGVGRQLLAAWCSSAAARGAEVAIADVGGDDPSASGFLAAHGFRPVGDLLVRRL
ncbi:GNAT family N-acetyltransferase [Dermatobacter hominis]|uniref:GNAT family N-acetyltransferase n=1 Tax=Dermatobacter hominis TaxID=2884263 RepID=UPI001D1111BF|nr:GNAT family N-acetyltransferase [Dermatobacter hominis]UDY37167.1 2'-5' RNA ligase family protein [Dermatobacter hominis]